MATSSARTVEREKPSRYPARPFPPSDPGAASHILSSSVILPAQFYGPAAGLDTTCGALALRRAVLEDAIGCFQKQTVSSGRRAQRLAREAEAWLFANDYNWPFSFVNICAVLGLDAEYVRLGLKRWRQHPMTKPQKRRQRGVLARQSLPIAA